MALLASAQGPNSSGDYYSAANGLKTALCHIIYSRTEQEYSALWSAFYTTDKRDGDGNKLWDMYSNHTPYLVLGTNQDTGSGGNVEGQYYNREHSFPQSWFGGENKKPMYTDLHHIYPTDKCVNGKRASYPFGETNGESYKSENNFSKLGACTYSGYSGTVFEPADEYKGDFARTYFYMVTCYEEKLHDWYTNFSSTDVVNVLDGNTYPGLKTWQLNMLMAWAAADPVSQKEINRNTAVKNIQGNRNPFIDYPGLEQYIWGSKTDVAFSYDNYEGSGSGSGGDDPTPSVAGTYKLTITPSDFNTTSYNANNNEKTSLAVCTTDASKTFEVKWTSYQVMKADDIKMQWQKGNGYIYNSTDLGSINSVTITKWSGKGTYTTYYGIAELPSSSTEVGGGYFKTIVGSNEVGYTKSVEITFTISGETPTPIASDLALTGAPIALSFDLNTNSAAQVIHYTTSSTGAVTVSSSSYVTTSVDASNKTITVTPTAVTPSTQTITVSQAADGTYAAGSATFTVTVTQTAQDYVTLPFSWEGGTKSALTGTTGVTAYGLGTDYAVEHAPYRVKLDDTGDCIKIKTDSQPSKVTINVKKVGGSYTSTITVQESSDGTTFTDVEDLSISGSQNSINILKTTNAFAASTRYVRLYFTKESNVGVGPIAIDRVISIGSSGYTTFVAPKDVSFPSGVTAYIATSMTSSSLSLTEKNSVPAGTPVILKGNAGTYSLTGTTTPENVTGNLLLASNGSVTGGTGIYALAKKNDVVGFYPVASSVTIPKDKAYINTGAQVKGYVFDFEDDATNIRSMEDGRSMMEDGIIYNVAGQRLNKMQKGLNIVGGRKIVGK